MARPCSSRLETFQLDQSAPAIVKLRFFGTTFVGQERDASSWYDVRLCPSGVRRSDLSAAIVIRASSQTSNAAVHWETIISDKTRPARWLNTIKVNHHHSRRRRRRHRRHRQSRRRWWINAPLASARRRDNINSSRRVDDDASDGEQSTCVTYVFRQHRCLRHNERDGKRVESCSAAIVNDVRRAATD